MLVSTPRFRGDFFLSYLCYVFGVGFGRVARGGWGDLLRLPSKITQIAHLLGAIGPFELPPASARLRQIHSSSVHAGSIGWNRFSLRLDTWGGWGGDIIIYREGWVGVLAAGLNNEADGP